MIGNSGVGKSSLVQAGVIGALKRQRMTREGSTDWPHQLGDSRAWSYLTMKPGNQPMRALAGAFTNLWFEDPTDPPACNEPTSGKPASTTKALCLSSSMPKSVHRRRTALIFGILGAITVVLFIASSAMFTPLTAKYNELLRTDPAAAEKLWSAPEYFWTLTAFYSLMVAVVLWIIGFFAFILKWSTYVVLRFLRERRSKSRAGLPATENVG